MTLCSTPEVLAAAGGTARLVHGLTPIIVTAAALPAVAAGAQATREAEDGFRSGLLQGAHSELLDLAG